jgi:predicted sugar kinase
MGCAAAAATAALVPEAAKGEGEARAAAAAVGVGGTDAGAAVAAFEVGGVLLEDVAPDAAAPAGKARPPLAWGVPGGFKGACPHARPALCAPGTAAPGGASAI